jgi:hypothetical protein
MAHPSRSAGKSAPDAQPTGLGFANSVPQCVGGFSSYRRGEMHFISALGQSGALNWGIRQPMQQRPLPDADEDAANSELAVG